MKTYIFTCKCHLMDVRFESSLPAPASRLINCCKPDAISSHACSIYIYIYIYIDCKNGEARCKENSLVLG